MPVPSNRASLTRLDVRTMTTSPLLRALSFVLVAVGLTGAARAHEPKLMSMLSAIDLVPTADQLRRVVTSPDVALDAVARDASLSPYLRERAISLFSVSPTRDVAKRLEALASAPALPARLRAMAVYTRVRGFAAVDAQAALAYATTLSRASDLDAREAAIRGLRWIALPGADAVLAGAFVAETHPPLKATIQHVQRARAELKRAAEAR